MRRSDYRQQILSGPTMEGLKYGTIAGLIATWSISTAIAASEVELHLPIGTFYAVMGISLGSIDFVTAAYVGFGLHIVTGTILGAVIGGIAVKVESRNTITNILRPYRSTFMGVGTGIIVWMILFLPITALIIQPSIGKIVQILSSSHDTALLSAINTNNLIPYIRGIAISAVVFHIVWGAIFGFIISSLLKIRISSLLPESSHSVPYPQSASSPLTTLSFGLAAGLISSLAISAMILLAEKISSLPVGTFYYVLVSALTNSFSNNAESVIVLGLAMHLLAGSLIGLVMSIPFIGLGINTRGDSNASLSKRASFIQKYSSAYGVAFGFGLWLVIFVPITFIIITPLLNSFENQDIVVRQGVPTGQVASVTFFGVLSMMDRILYGAIAFNIFYGLLTAILLQSFSEKYLVSSKNKIKEQKEKAQGAA